MRMEMPLILQLGILLFIASDFSVLGSAGFSTSPSSATFFAIPSPETAPGLANHGQPSTYNAPASPSRSNGSVLLPPLALSPSPTALPPTTSKGALTPLSGSSPLHNLSPHPFNVQSQAPLIAPSEAQRKAPPIEKPPFSVAPAPFETPLKSLPQYPPSRPPTTPLASPPTADVGNMAPVAGPLAPEHDIPPSFATSPTPPAKKSIEVPASAPINMPKDSPLTNDDPYKGPSPDSSMRHSHYAHPPFSSSNPPFRQRDHRPASSPAISYTKHKHSRSKIISPLPAPSYPVSSRTPAVSPSFLPRSRTRDHSPPTPYPISSRTPAVSPSFLPRSRTRDHSHPTPLDSASRISPFHSFPLPPRHVSPPHPSQKIPSGAAHVPVSPPKVSPAKPSKYAPKTPLLPPLKAFPPPPPNPDCLGTICTDPYTNTPPNSPCACVLPIQVGLRLGIDLYTFFPLVSELAKEIAASIFLKQSQVRIIGASAANQQAEKTVVLIDLVPLGEKFDFTTALLTYQRFWLKQVAINASFFGDYEVLYVQYPGLPPSPPGVPNINSQPYLGNNSNSNNNNGRTIKPIGVDVHSRRHNDRLTGGMITIIALSTFLAMVFCIAVAWILVFGQRDCFRLQKAAPEALLSSLSKLSGMAGSTMGSMRSSVSLSLESSMATYMGSAKTFSANDMEMATNHFDHSRILGEGGFGRVYSGVLEDGMKVAVKVLKRDDHHGGREFCAEVEMLSRLHHRNLVKLIGICTEDRIRCLVYELIPNGSVESHLHGVDKEKAPLDWTTRMKIALGAARGLAYLHEDSSPRVIHRDFKASNILLECDFTPKVSDFGLARTAMDEESRHISTRVMGTFGYVAPEYAMTGHLLVKSDVYSYGVVLLELLTGRKPIDMSQPPGRENLVAWARSLLTSREGLESIIDKSLGSNAPFDSIAKVAAIASMCVQPEVTNRPFMGEVVQALKLVCNECDEKRKSGSRHSSREAISIDIDADPDSRGLKHFPHSLYGQYSPPNFDNGMDSETRLSISELLSSSARFQMHESRSFQRQSSSGPLSTRRVRPIWQRMRFSGESVSKSGFDTRFWPGSN